MVGQQRILESRLFHAGQATGATRRREHERRGRRYLQVSCRFSNWPDAKLQSQFNSYW